MNKILTISIAAYNVEKYLRETVLSCLSDKTINEIEILIIDDGSKDNTKKIAEELQGKYPETIRYIEKDNGGYGSTVNLGIKLAKGYYFKLLDGDDWFDVEGLEFLLNNLKAHDVDMVLSPNIKYFENGEADQIRDNVPNMDCGPYNIEDMDIPGSINMHSITYRTQLLRNINLKLTEHCFYTDTEFVVFPLQYVKRIYVTHIPVYYYRIGIEGQSTEYNGIREHFADHTKVLKHIFNFYKKIPDKMQPTAKWIYRRLIGEVSVHYHYICMLKFNISNWMLLKDFDDEIKTNENIYKDCAKHSRFVALLRKSHFLLYPLCYLWEQR